jgi:hypothetical protein
LSFALFASLIAVQNLKTTAAGQTSLSLVNPLTGDGWFNFTTFEKNLNDVFVINITVEDVAYLCTWQFELSWNSSLLTFVDVTIPPDNVFESNPIFNYSDAWTPGVFFCGGGLVNVSESFTGSGILCQIRLKIIQNDCNSNLSFEGIGVDTYLIDNGGKDILFTPINGYYSYTTAQIIGASWLPTCPPPYVNSNQTRINEPVLVKVNLTGFPPQMPSTCVVLKFRRTVSSWFNTTMSFNSTEALWIQTLPGQSSNCTIEFFIEVQLSTVTRTSSAYSFYVKPLAKGDVNGDGIVNMRDITICILNFNKRE